MNTGRIVTSGLLAGLVLNFGEGLLHGVVISAEVTATYELLQRPIGETPATLAMLVGITFIQGILGMLIYALSLNTWPAGIGTAIRVGLILWVLSGVYSAVYLHAGWPGVFPPRVVWIPVLWEAVQYPLAILVGSLLYKK